MTLTQKLATERPYECISRFLNLPTRRGLFAVNDTATPFVMNPQIRVAVVASHPIQHFCPLYRALVADGRVTLHVLFASSDGENEYLDVDFAHRIRWQPDLLSGFPFSFLPGAATRRVQGVALDCPGLRTALSDYNPDVVQFYGYYHGISRRAIRWARYNKRPCLQMSDSELKTPRGPLTRLRKRLTVPFFLRRTDALLTVGDCNEQYYQFYGAPLTKCFRSPLPIDESRMTSTLRDRTSIRRQFREQWDLPPGAVVALVVGKLTARKCAAHAIEAIGRLRRNGESALYLVLAGDGPERAALQQLSSSAGHAGITFVGFIDVTELPKYYSAADFLIHPSSADPHPLAISEAIFSGLPAIVSDRVGSVGPTDDVRPGQNGLVYPFGDLAELQRATLTIAKDHDLRAKMSAESFRIGHARTLAVSVQGYVDAVRSVLETHTRKADQGRRQYGESCS